MVVRDDSQLFRLLVQSVLDYAIFRLTPEGIVETWNSGAERLKGYAAFEIIGRSFETFYTPEDLAAGRPGHLLKLARTEGRVEDEGWRVRKDGTRFWADVVITALFENGQLVGYAKVTRDVSERRRSEEQRSMRLAAERAAERLGRLQTVTAALTAVSRPEQVAELLASVGFTALGAVGGAVAFPVHDDDNLQPDVLQPDVLQPDVLQPEALQVVSVSGLAMTTIELNQRIRRDEPLVLAEAWRRGVPIFVPSRDHLAAFPHLIGAAIHSLNESWAAAPLMLDRRLLAVMTMTYAEPHAFDEDERNLIMAIADVGAQAIGRAELFEIERRTRAEAEAAMRAQDEFLSIASHELRTPVAAVKATAQLAQRSMQRGTLDPPRLERHLESIRRAADRLASLVEDLLDVSRLRTGRLELHRQCIELAPLVEEIVERYRIQLEDQHEYAINLSLPPHSILADVDPSRIEQVLDNFLSNAVKYSPSGGRIDVAVELDAEGFRLTVADQGIGLPPGQTETIFEPFGRASNASVQQIPGLGLGLSICKQLIEAHGGHVWATSRGELHGTTVGFWLPHPRLD